MSQDLAVLDKYFKEWLCGNKIEAALIRTEAIRRMFFEENSKKPVLRELISEEASDLAFRVDTQSYEDWLEYHKRDNNNSKEFTRINTLLMLKFKEDITFEEAVKLHSNECQYVRKTSREKTFEFYLMLHMTDVDVSKLDTNYPTKEAVLNKLLMFIEMIGQPLLGFSKAVFAGEDLSKYEKFIDGMSDDVVFDSGLDPDSDNEHKNAYMTLALAYLHLGKKEDVRRVLKKLENVIEPTFTYYWLFRFLQKEIHQI